MSASRRRQQQVEELAAAVQDATGDTVELAYVDQGYTGTEAELDAEGWGIRLVVVKHTEAKRGFVLLPRRWVVERSFAWLSRYRRLNTIFERTDDSLIAFVQIAGLVARRIICHLKPGQTVVEATSGNTGIALAMVCAARGYPFVAFMSDSFSVERRKLMRALGAKVILTPAAERGSGGANAGSLIVAITIGVTSWAWGARVLRAQTLSLRRRDYVEASRATETGGVPGPAHPPPGETGAA